MSESQQQPTCKGRADCPQPAGPPTHRAILHPADPPLGKTEVAHLDESGFRPQNSQPSPQKRRPNSLTKSILPLLIFVFILLPSSFILRGDIVTGNLVDLGDGPLSTALTFTPTNVVQIQPDGLDAGPALTIYSKVGYFSNRFNAGDYWVSLPLIRWRKAFLIHVHDGTNVVNITNLFDIPIVYVGTNFITNGITTEIGEVIQYDP